MVESNQDVFELPSENQWAYKIAIWAGQNIVTRVIIVPILVILAIYNYGLPIIFLVESIQEQRWGKALAWFVTNIVLYGIPMWAFFHYVL